MQIVNLFPVSYSPEKTVVFVRRIVWQIVLFLLFSVNVSAKQPPASGNISKKKIEKNFGSRNLSFIENKGQIVDQYQQRRNDIDFSLAAAGGLNIFIGDGAVHYQFSKCENPEQMQPRDNFPFDTGVHELEDSLVYSMYRMDVELVGANKDAEIIREEKQRYYENHYTNGLTGTDARTYAYNRITYKDVYPHIDWVLYTKGRELKHEFVVHEGGRVSDIRLRYGGAKQLHIDDGGVLSATTPQGTITEQPPYSYQLSGQEIVSRFVLKDSILRYDVDDYKGELIIDPTLDWATYLGGGLEDWIIACTTDKLGSVAVTGRTQSPSGIATSGAYMYTFAGTIFDAFLAKFSNSGDLSWATYYGGSGPDIGRGVATDDSCSIFVTGDTYSTTGIATSGAFQSSFGGFSDAFIGKFDSSGALQWATYLGGSNEDDGLCIVKGTHGSVYVAGYTRSASGIATSGTYASHGFGDNDVFIVKFSSSGNRVWGTYYGGHLTDVPHSIETDNAGNVYVCGQTNSTSEIATTGAHQISLGGPNDGFLAKFGSTGNLAWATYYGGAGYDYVFDVVFRHDYLFISGKTESDAGIATSGVFQESYGGGYGDNFLVKFSTDGSREWGTYYGSGLQEGYGYLEVDDSGYIYLAGTTTSTSGIATAGVPQPSFGGGSGDSYIVKFDDTGARQWCTYFGGEGMDEIRSLSLDMSGNLFFAGITGSTTGVATSGAYQPTFHGIPFDGVVGKIRFELPPILGPDTVCIGDMVIFGNATAYGQWSVSDTSIAVMDSVSIYTAQMTTLSVGIVTITYTVGEHFVTKGIVVFPLSDAGIISGSDSLCTGVSEVFTTSADTGGIWLSSDTMIAVVSETGMVSGRSEGSVYISYVISNRCSIDTAVHLLYVLPIPSTFSGSLAVCNGSSTSLSVAPSGGYWRSIDTAVAVLSDLGGGSSMVTGVSPGTSVVSYVRFGCGVSETVTVNALPDAGVLTGADSVCRGGSVLFSATAVGGFWSSSDVSVAIVGSAGTITGVNGGTALITYSVTNVCGTDYITHPIIVKPFPTAGLITGAGSLCVGDTALLSNPVSGGNWMSANPSVVSVSSSGEIIGLAPGATLILYILTNSCGSVSATKSVTVNPIPVSGTISGASTLCAGNTTLYSSTEPGGSWSSSYTPVATVGSSGLVSGIAAGTTTISYVVANSCGSAFTTATLTVNPTPDAGAIAGASTVCAGATETLIATVPGGAWSSSDVSVAAISSTGVVSGVSAGTVVISYAVSFSCGDVFATKVLTVNPLPDAGVLSGVLSVCVGSSTTLSSTTPGGIWSSSNTAVATVSSGLLSGVSAGTATISYTITNGCGSASTTAVVTVNPLPDAGTLSGALTVCAGSSTMLSSNISGGAWSSSGTSVATVSTTGNVSGVSAGTATISYTVTNGCGTASSTTIVTVNPLPDAGIISGGSSVCVGNSTTLSSTISGGVWTSSNTIVATVSTIGSVTGVAAGTATISYTVTNGCGAATTASVVTVNPLPDAGTLSGASSVCAGNTITIGSTASGGLWTSSNTAVATVVSGTVSGMSAGAATISYAVTNGCGTATTTKSVTINPLPDAGVVSGTTTVCVGSSTTLTSSVSGGAWTSGNTTVATVSSGMISGVSAGTTSISYTTTNGCGTASATTIITVNALPDAGALSGALSVCSGSSTTLSSTMPGGVWTSSNSFIATVLSGVVSGITAGTATISYTASNGCGASTTTSVVTVNPLPVAGAISGSATLCQGSITSLTTTVTGGVWTSSNTAIATVSPTGVVLGVSGGTATISYSRSNSCGTVAAIRVVTVNPLPTAGSVSGSSSVCVGSIALLSGSVSGGVWSSSNTAVATVSGSGIVLGISAGTTTVSYTVSNSCGTVTATKIVTVLPLPTTGVIAGSGVLCQGSTALMTSSVSGGVWSSSDASVVVISGIGMSAGTSSGTALISYTATNSCGTATATHPVTVNPLPSAGTISGVASLCAGNTTIFAASVSGGVWASSDATVANVSATGAVTGVSDGTAVISYTVANSCGSAIATKIVTVNALPSLTTTSSVLCSGTSTSIAGTPSGGTWSSSSSSVTVSSSGIATGTVAGTATISYTLPTGCSHSAVVTVNPAPAGISGSTSVCEGNTTMLSSTSVGGIWGSTATTVSIDTTTGMVTGVSSGTALISYTLPTGCATYAIVTVNPLPATITGAHQVCTGVSTMLSIATVGGSWVTTDTNVSVSTGGLLSGMYSGTATVHYVLSTGCRQSHAVTVTPTPTAITGATSVCEGQSTSLSVSLPTTGIWTSDDISIASIDSATGIATGVSSGSTTITYRIPSTGCYNFSIMTVNPQPTILSGADNVCEGANITFSGSIAGGSWISGSLGVATIGSTSGLLTGMTSGSTIVSYTLPGGCFATDTVTVNDLPTVISGVLSVCEGQTTALSSTPAGGIWTSASPIATLDTVTGLVTGLAHGTASLSYTLPTGCGVASVVTVNETPTTIIGGANICVGDHELLTDTTAGGVWSSSDAAIASAGATTGLVSGLSVGTVSISYTLPSGCGVSKQVTVHALPIITAADTVICVNEQISLINSDTSSGVWNSADPSVATVVDVLVSGVVAGTASISYTSSFGCATSIKLTVEPLPYSGMISGDTILCVGTEATFTSSISGGEWTSSDTSILGLLSDGQVKGIATGAATVSYSITSECGIDVAMQQINVQPKADAGAISGPDTLCAGSEAVLLSSVSGGEWYVTDHQYVTVNGGRVTGIRAGATAIQYVVSGMCGTDTARYELQIRSAEDCSPVYIIRIHPNPTSGNFIVETPVAGSLMIYTVDGRKLWDAYKIPVGITHISLPNYLARGFYMCRFIGEDGSGATEKLVLKPQ